MLRPFGPAGAASLKSRNRPALAAHARTKKQDTSEALLTPEGFIQLGTIARPHGIKGEVAVDWYADAPPNSFPQLWLCKRGMNPRPVPVLSCRNHKGRPLLWLEGISSRDEAEALRGCALCVPRANLPEPASDEAYLADLLGADVYLPDGDRLGRLDHVEMPAGQEVWAIKTDSGHEILFPAQPEFIRSFNLKARQVCIDPPPGLLDVYLA